MLIQEVQIEGGLKEIADTGTRVSQTTGKPQTFIRVVEKRNKTYGVWQNEKRGFYEAEPADVPEIIEALKAGNLDLMITGNQPNRQNGLFAVQPVILREPSDVAATKSAADLAHK